MAVDRAFRRRVADHIAKLLRGEIDFREYVCRGAELRREAKETGVDDPSALDLCVSYPLGCKLKPTKPIPCKMWDTLRRELAFLETDLEYGPPAELRVSWVHSRGQLAAILLLTGGGVAAYVLTVGAGRGVLLVVWIMLGLPRMVLVDRMGQKDTPPECAPFEDEAQWHANRRRLDRFDLPDEPLVLKMSARPPASLWKRAWAFLKDAIVNAATVPLAVLLMIVTGPFWMVTEARSK